MAITSAADLESRFQENDSPTSADFAAVFDSFLHKVSAAGTALAVRSLGAGLAGSAMFAAATTAAERSLLGLIAGEATTTASAQTIMGGGTVGVIQFAQITTASAQTVMGGGAAGRTVFEAITTASARQGLDIAVATTAQMSGPTNTSSAFVTPGLLSYHPLMPKGWAEFEGTGTVSLLDSWNVASIGDLGTGVYRVNWGSAFESNRYAVLFGTKRVGGTFISIGEEASAGSKEAGNTVINTATSGPSPTAVDVSSISILVMNT